ncbi:hypothetical protein M441DRAFT_60380 [Trichoderma asperellum CBS 433.97]|uniref:Uncharacterized protein n=1 Tax=Trichoderma asperellum (strain ATCC 204424 / CBS 433.97 / NBRC 101777) TaxID=1042311 RepID=A0A2T3YZU0_TRIA4|nr:hypothetical protein M441DRAFT_60380 [Trichoderma asperellum CBS 433.97]PTB38089.1 hypothetical protein M441DRAFT_60380 [Trichoderma asperellum CBS 433.97]
MGVQKTFTIIPPAGPAERTPIDVRPMTSKQVRKAYQAANRVPRVSRAERIRQERAEQERIRKEFEKEKAAAKAKLLRDKKKAKEQAEREEKKKKGLPLVTVRPSQDTIAKFFRGNGLGHKRGCESEDVGETTDTAKASALPVVDELAEDDDDDDDDFPSPKRLCNERETNGEDEEEVEKRREETSTAPEETCAEIDVAEERQNEPIIEDDFFDGFEILSDEEISKLSFNETVTNIVVDKAKEVAAPQPRVELNTTPVEERTSHLHDKTTPQQSNPAMPIKNPEPIALQEFDLIFDDEEDLELEMLALDAVVTSQQRPTKKPTEKALPQTSQKPTRKTTGYEIDLGIAACSSPVKETHQPKSQKERDQTSLMPPPPIPSASRPSISPLSPIAAIPQAPPLSTQQILFNMDDFFPTSSQQAAELEEEETTFISSPLKSCLASEARAPNPPRVSQKNSLPSGTLSSSPEPPKPFFTASGSNERMAVALLRSRRTAEQEEERRRQTMQLELAEIQKARKKEAERRAREEKLADGKLKPKYANHAALRTVRDESRISNPASPASPAIIRMPQFSARKRLIMNDNRTPVKPTPQRTPLVQTNPKTIVPDTQQPIVANMSRKVTSLGANIRPCPSSLTSHSASRTLAQEARHQYSSPKHANTPTKSANKPEGINTSPEASESKRPPASQESEFGGGWMDELATELCL